MTFLNQSQISNCIYWLTASASPAVRYLTHRHILHDDPRSQPMVDLWQQVETSREAEVIFSRQNPDGSWFSGGPWGPRGYRQQTGRGYNISRPKFVTTAWILPFLGDMGFTAADQRVKNSCDLMLQETSYERLTTPPAEANCCGLYGIPLRAFASVGMALDPRIQGGWDWLTACQRTDGGWLNPRHLADSPNPSTTIGRWPWNRSCAWGSYYPVEALYLSKNPDWTPVLKSSLQFMLWHLSQQDIRRIQTWAYHGHNIVKELLMFSETGFDMRAQPIQALLDWLKGYYRHEEGMFRTQEKPIPDFVRQINAIVKDFEETQGPDFWHTWSKNSPELLRYQLYHLVEDDWLTYYLTRIAIRL